MLERVIKQINLSDGEGRAYLLISQKKDSALEMLKLLVSKLDIKSPDLFLEEGEDSVKINLVREIKKFLTLKPHSSPYKIAIISNAHKLTVDAGNALLKILEETPKNSFIFLIAASKSQLLATIVSRCQVIRLKQLGQSLPLEITRAITKDFDNLARMSIKDRFDLAKKLSSEENLNDLLTKWLMVLRDQSRINPKGSLLIKKILIVQKLVNYTNINTRLLLENLLLLF